MATYTDNYNLIKPTYAETADIVPLNNNFEKIDEVMHASQTSLAPAYNQTASYQPGAVVMYELNMYKCTGATSGTWDPEKWTRTTAAETGGGGSVDFDIFGEGSGSVVTITDGAEAGLAECIVEIEATQSGSGTPSPSNVRPIVGRSEVNISVTGKNLLPNTGIGATVNGITYVVNDDGSVTASGTATGTSTFRIITTTDLFKLKAGNYTISGGISANRALGFKTVDGTTQYNNSGDTSFTLSEETTWDYIFIRIASGEILNNVTFYPMIRLASESSSEYEPYNGSTTTIPLGRTVYGGTLDVTRGVLTVTHELVTAPTRGNVDSSGKLYTLVFSPSIAIKSWGQTEAPSTYIKSNMFDVEGLSEARASEDKCLVQYGTAIYVGGYIGEETALDTLLATLQIKYELATPQTYTLTTEEVSTILGYNNISADSGEVSVVYVKQTAPIKPNPTGADIPLTGIEIDGEKFKIPSGANYKTDVLLDETNGVTVGITYGFMNNHTLDEYDAIEIIVATRQNVSGGLGYDHWFMTVRSLLDFPIINYGAYEQRWFYATFTNNSVIQNNSSGDQYPYIYRIYGIKY